MPDVAAVIKLLQERYPAATVGLDNGRPYARMPDGALYGVLFHSTSQGQEPLAIVQFLSKHLSTRNLLVVERLDEAPR